MMRWAVALVCLGGCDKLFGLPDVHGEATVDAAALVDAPDASIDAPSYCPGNYDITVPGFPNSRYVFQPITEPWLSAQTRCMLDAKGAGRTHLVVIQDKNERMALYGELRARNVTVTAWIGLSDRNTEGQFLWVTDEPVGMPSPMVPPWPPNQPDNANNQDCVRMKAYDETTYGGFFDDGGCDLDFASVCECDAHAAYPTNY